jgi:hypothetical protein
MLLDIFSGCYDRWVIGDQDKADTEVRQSVARVLVGCCVHFAQQNRSSALHECHRAALVSRRTQYMNSLLGSIAQHIISVITFA